MNNLGNAYLNLNEFLDAEKIFRDCIEINNQYFPS
jgi:hypothetical protein